MSKPSRENVRSFAIVLGVVVVIMGLIGFFLTTTNSGVAQCREGYVKINGVGADSRFAYVCVPGYMP